MGGLRYGTYRKERSGILENRGRCGGTCLGRKGHDTQSMISCS